MFLEEANFFPVSLLRIKLSPEGTKSIFFHAGINAQVNFKSLNFNLYFSLL